MTIITKKKIKKYSHQRRTVKKNYRGSGILKFFGKIRDRFRKKPQQQPMTQQHMTQQHMTQQLMTQQPMTQQPIESPPKPQLPVAYQKTDIDKVKKNYEQILAEILQNQTKILKLQADQHIFDLISVVKKLNYAIDEIKTKPDKAPLKEKYEKERNKILATINLHREKIQKLKDYQKQLNTKLVFIFSGEKLLQYTTHSFISDQEIQVTENEKKIKENDKLLSELDNSSHEKYNPFDGSKKEIKDINNAFNRVLKKRFVKGKLNNLRQRTNDVEKLALREFKFIFLAYVNPDYLKYYRDQKPAFHNLSEGKYSTLYNSLPKIKALVQNQNKARNSEEYKTELKTLSGFDDKSDEEINTVLKEIEGNYEKVNKMLTDGKITINTSEPKNFVLNLKFLLDALREVFPAQ
jgi:hypothetical protein